MSGDLKYEACVLLQLGQLGHPCFPVGLDWNQLTTLKVPILIVSVSFFHPKPAAANQLPSFRATYNFLIIRHHSTAPLLLAAMISTPYNTL